MTRQPMPSGPRGTAIPGSTTPGSTVHGPDEWRELLDEQWAHHLAEYTRLSIELHEADEHGPYEPAAAPPGDGADTAGNGLPGVSDPAGVLDPAGRSDLAGRVARHRHVARLVSAERHALAEVEAALARLAAGAHGVCQQCGDAITPQRLEILPQTRFCASCRRAASTG